MARHSDQVAIERAAAVIIKVADRYSNYELDAARSMLRNRAWHRRRPPLATARQTGAMPIAVGRGWSA
jgi:hypothetical protein